MPIYMNLFILKGQRKVNMRENQKPTFCLYSLVGQTKTIINLINHQVMYNNLVQKPNTYLQQYIKLQHEIS